MDEGTQILDSAFRNSEEVACHMEALFKGVIENVEKDILNRLKALEQENDELRRYLEMANRLEQERAGFERRVLRMRLEELVRPFTQSVWRVELRRVYVHDKCDQCDEHRERHFTSPMGRHMKEECACAEQKWLYFVEEVKVVKLDHNNRRDTDWYDYLALGDSEYESLKQARVYKGEAFDGSLSRDMLFLDKDKAEEFAKWLNDRNS